MGGKLPFKFCGITYTTFRNACIELGVTYVAARQRVRGGQTREEAISSLLTKKAERNPTDLHNAGKLPLKPYARWPDKL